MMITGWYVDFGNHQKCQTFSNNEEKPFPKLADDDICMESFGGTGECSLKWENESESWLIRHLNSRSQIHHIA